MKKIIKIFVLTLCTALCCVSFAACGLFSDSGSEDSSQQFDRTPYIGKYYFSSEVSTWDGGSSTIQVGDKPYSYIYTKEYVTLTVSKDSYTLRYDYPTVSYTSGEWKKDSFYEDMFNFYNNGVLTFSAQMKDGVWTHRTNGYNGSYTVLTLIRE